jgi:tRNA nucleotidyltransferase (CCA-adding enzyme)
MHLDLPALDVNNWSFSPDLLPKNTYLVGGAVRDALLGRKKAKPDLDFVLAEDAVGTARKVANAYQAGFVLLDADREIARVVFDNGTVDFARQEGKTLAVDLQRRDFTVNAIAYNFTTQELIDPLGGYPDLQNRVLRMVKRSNLEDDPLRLLRGYRQAAQLRMAIETETLAAMRELAPLITTVAAERVQAELNYLLEPSSDVLWLKAAVTDGLLAPWLSHTETVQLEAVEASAKLLTQTWAEIGNELVSNLKGSFSTSLLAIAKLTALLPADAEVAANKLIELKYSRVEIKGVTAVVSCLLEYGNKLPELSIRDQFFLFHQAGNTLPAIATLAMARGIMLEEIAPLIKRYLTPEDPVAHPIPLVTGNELMQALNLPSGQIVGELILKLQIARAEGKVTTSQAALDLAARILRGEG